MSQNVQNAIEAMISGQLAGRGIADEAVLDAFARVPRHVFVDPADADWAYGDHPLPIGFRQTISQPYIVALSLQAAHASGCARVLEIGTGSGYQTALLAVLAGEVWTVERIGPLRERAERSLAGLGLANVRYRVGNGWNGWAEGAPFDAIVVSAAAKIVPPALFRQLKEGGRLVIPVGDAFRQELMLFEKRDGAASGRPLCECRFVPLVDAE